MRTVIQPRLLGDGVYVSRGVDHSYQFGANHHENVSVVIQREDMVSLMQYIAQNDPALASVMANQVHKE